ncbi:hypothetical protein GCM10023088_83800 [Actinomadura verrucosospora]
MVGLVDTLLGPEGTGASPVASDYGTRTASPHGGVVLVGPVVF